MPTSIYKYDGTLLTTVADSTLDSTHATIRFPGRGYQNYGEPVMENFVWMLQNFAGTTAPTLPLAGQCWFDATVGTMKIYNGISWVAAGGVIINASEPAAGASLGDFWYDSTNLQLNTWNGSGWDLVGPLGSVGNDPLDPAVPSNSKIDALRISDGSSNHKCWRVTIGGTVVAIISKDPEFTPTPSISGFVTIKPGINLSADVSNATFSGDLKAFRADIDNIPDSDNTYDLGSLSNRFSNMFSVNGTISSRLTINAEVSSHSFEVNGTSLFRNTAHFITSTSRPGIKMLNGNLLTSPEVGSIEFNGSDFYLTSNISGVTTRFPITPGAAGSFSNNVSISSTSQSTNTNTGALVVTGGAGIGGDLNVGGNINVDGNIVVSGSNQVIIDSGSASRPGMAFFTSRSTGVFSPGSNSVAVSTASTERIRINSVGAVGLSGENYGTAGQVITSFGNSAPPQWTNIGVIPTGGVIPYAVPGSVPPPGFLFCDGATHNISSYPLLGAALGSAYGGDGVTTFAVPDLRGRVVAGKDDMGGTSANRLTGQSGGVDGDILGAAGGAERHTLTIAEMPSHDHTFVSAFVTGNSESGSGDNEASNQTRTTNLTGGSGSHNNVQPTFILNYIIKT